MKRIKISKKAILVIAVLMMAAFGAGRFTAGSKDTTGEKGEETASDENKPRQKYVCPMNISYHPYFSSYDPNERCGFCGMELVPDTSGGNDLGERVLSMSKSAMKLAEVRTAPVEKKYVDISIPMVGKVDYDETRVKTISAWTAGRLDRLFVDYTGIPVKEGDHLVEIYSPELYTAQEELLQAIKAQKEMRETTDESNRRTTESTVDAVREKLKLLGLNEEQIAGIEKRTSPAMLTEIKAPIGGIVIKKNATEGMYVNKGTPIYTVADLSKVWVKLDAYESDLAWIKYGQQVEIRSESYGDKAFNGWISFVNPVLNPDTRTVKVRVVVDNREGLLRPNMFVRAVVKARVGDGDVVLSTDLDGKWICPMHPEVVEAEAGACSVCGMDLVRAVQLGYEPDHAINKPIVVPASAVLRTGKRAIVYRKVKGSEKPAFEGVQIEIGPRAGDYYIVRSGLNPGDLVVINGNFKIDSALQLQAKPSMMSPVIETPPSMKMDEGKIVLSATDDESLAGLVTAYFEVQKALVEDNPEAAARKATELTRLSGRPGLAGEHQESVAELLNEIAATAKTLAAEKGIQKQRETFATLSAAMEALLMATGTPKATKVYKAFCPMAFDNKGGYWLQPDDTVLNPYFGDAMLHCGEIKGQLNGSGKEAHHESH